jgi:hypothetical protein
MVLQHAMRILAAGPGDAKDRVSVKDVGSAASPSLAEYAISKA